MLMLRIGLSASTPEQQGKEQIDIAHQPDPTFKQLSNAPKTTNQHEAVTSWAGKGAAETKTSK